MAANTLAASSLRASAFAGAALPTAAAAKPAQAVKAAAIVCRAEDATAVSRRAASLSALLAGAAALTLKADPALAAYGEAANVFGKRGNTTGFVTYQGSGFKLEIPSKWNKSKEIEYPGTIVRYEDNFDAVSNLSVIVTPAKKSSITDYGSPESFLSEVGFLLGESSYSGQTSSEGGFATDQVATAAVLKTSTPTLAGKTYYKISLLTRTADGDEGGRHQLITATVSDGKLYILKTQVGDKRWFKGSNKLAEGTDASFLVA